MPQMFKHQKPIHYLPFVCAALLALLMSACSSRPKPPSLEEQTEKLAEAMEKGGYAPARSLPIDSVREVWMHDGTELEAVMTAPTGGGNYPLIIYLPSLGEDAMAGRLWRETWAKAGYAVFSLQPLAIGQALKQLGPERSIGNEDDDQPEQSGDNSSGSPGETGGKRSKTARNSELRYLGHEYFAIDKLKNRMTQLFWAYQQLKAKAGSGLPLYAAADFSKVILAGYDLGAQTVAAVLGENFADGLPSSSELKPMAAMVLSPSIDLAEGNVRSRFQKLTLPMLVITGSEDNDPYAISSASVRSALWEYAPPGGKYLLLLKGGVHQLLAGSDISGRFGLGGFGNREPGGPGDGGRMRQTDNRLGGHGRGRNSGGFGGMMGGLMGNTDQKNADLGYKQVAAVSSATAAFLDTVVKNDEFAKFWLDDKANKWLDSAGSLKIR